MLWWRCHRCIITDYLLAHGVTVFHILSLTDLVPARFNESASINGWQYITYGSNPETHIFVINAQLISSV
ncbi:hypothetical protein [Acetobacter syzygii]|nr:hypothetical protein [Acetobacter syzygii]